MSYVDQASQFANNYYQKAATRNWLATVRPLIEFVSLQYFSFPDSFQTASRRVDLNTTYFLSNYAVIAVLTLVYALIFKPHLLLATAFIAFAAYIFFFKYDAIPITANFTLSVYRKGIVFALLASVFLVFFASTLIIIFLVACVIILAHATLHSGLAFAPLGSDPDAEASAAASAAAYAAAANAITPAALAHSSGAYSYSSPAAGGAGAGASAGAHTQPRLPSSMPPSLQDERGFSKAPASFNTSTAPASGPTGAGAGAGAGSPASSAAAAGVAAAAAMGTGAAVDDDTDYYEDYDEKSNLRSHAVDLS